MKEIKNRIERAKRVFLQKRCMCKVNIDLKMKLKFLKTYIWCIARYGCETWTIEKLNRKRVEAFKMWCYKKMLRIQWIEKVLERIGSKRKI